MRKPIVFFVVLLIALSPTPAPALLLNLSTRVEIPPPALGEDVTSLIGGFIIGGNSGRKILRRQVIGLDQADPNAVILTLHHCGVASRRQRSDDRGFEIVCRGQHRGPDLGFL